ncbi:MAG: HIT domain-containing protein [Alphaproteobacteria bacterium]|nr:MAG: HIT domain-containing protein [Alphaproteobacteria bacterium]
MHYDDSNVFAKILNKEIPCSKVYEDEHTLAFKDLHPKARIHILIIPKSKCKNFSDLLNMDAQFITNFFNGVKNTIKQVNPDNLDFKLLTNNGINAGQEIFHMHFHLLIN